MTLKQYVRKVRTNPNTICQPIYVKTQIFTDGEEKALSDYPRPMTIFDIGKMANKAYAQTFTQLNIFVGYSAAGIEPFNSNVSRNDEFHAYSTTDRPEPIVMSAITDVTQQSGETVTATANPTTPGLSSDQLEPIATPIPSVISATDDVAASAVPSTSNTKFGGCPFSAQKLNCRTK